MCFRDFPNQAVSPQHANLASRARALPFQFGGSDFGGPVQQGTQVTIAEAVDGKFAPVHCGQEMAVVRTEGLQSTDAPPLPFGGLAEFLDGFPQGLVMIYGRQRFQVALVRFLADFSTPMQIGHPLPQPLPCPRFRGILGDRPRNFRTSLPPKAVMACRTSPE